MATLGDPGELKNNSQADDFSNDAKPNPVQSCPVPFLETQQGQ